MNNIKMICLDIDGTLLNSSHKISEKVKNVINIVANGKNIPVILVSARMPKGIRFLQKELGIDQPIICYSGALVLDKDDKMLSKEFIDVFNVEEIYKLVKDNNIHISIYKDNEWYIEEMEYWSNQESEITNIIPKIADFNELIELWKKEGTGPNKILCMSTPDKINFLKDNLKASDLNIYPSKPAYLEIMPTKASKTSAINCLQKKFNVDKSEIIAMGNAPDDVKKYANDVTLTNDEDGVAEALEKYIIL
ncbi:Cof-type HAD-IIB family hydrolase [Clostridium vincentii]|uniref:Putative phosphatase n=1 Tax=Clostridium vincentii TaxID=52704 RepID=A0A2T0BAC5_9CLOT|nr:Cof-type HAD-IIB family hydrolase [Clostridium vincentii]PRR80792.1 putative phosphatase [Clostridium vincentii]